MERTLNVPHLVRHSDRGKTNSRTCIRDLSACATLNSKYLIPLEHSQTHRSPGRALL
jgi:hypothetical protein